MQPQLGDPVAVAAHDGEPPPVDDQVVALVRDAAEPGQHEAGEGLVVTGRGREAGGVADLVGAQQPRDEPGVPAGRPHPGRRLVVVLVLDLADDLLEDVLEGDDPGDAAVLVDDHGELQAGAAQGGHERVAVEGLRDGGHGPDALAQRGGGAGRRGHGEGLLDVDDAEDGVEVVGADGEAGDAGAAGVGDEVGEGVVGGKGQHAGARGHEVLGDPLGEPQRPVHEGGGGGVEGAVAAAGADEGAELAGGAGRAQLLDRLDADGAHDGVGGGVEGGDEQAQGAGEPGLQPDDGAGGAQGVGDRDVLGDELAEDHRQRRGDYQGQGRGEPAGEPLGHADRGQAGPDEGGDGGFGDVAGDQGGDR